jgi:hypothetical protein
MSINYSQYKRTKTKSKKLERKFGYPGNGSMPNEVRNLSKYSDTRNRDYFEYNNEFGAYCILYSS